MVPKRLRRTFANFHGSIGWLSAQNRLAYTCKIANETILRHAICGYISDNI